jgi:hypothetical protein
MALAARSSAPIPAGYDPIIARFAAIARGLSAEDLGEAELSAADIEDALGLGGAGRRQRLLLGYYTAAGLEHALHAYGVLGYLRRIGYDRFRVTLDPTGAGERVRLHGSAAGEEHLLIEVVLEKRRIAGEDVLYLHWLSLRNPRARSSAARPLLPGQDVPGLGLASETVKLLTIMARRLGLAGLVYRPAHFHTAFPARHALEFLDPARQGRFEALVRDLARLPLREATVAIDEGRVSLDGAPYPWEAEEMALWLAGRGDPARPEAIRGERERAHFTVSERPGA